MDTKSGSNNTEIKWELFDTYIYTWLLVCGQSFFVTLLETNISPTKALLKMIFLVPKGGLLVLWRAYRKYLDVTFLDSRWRTDEITLTLRLLKSIEKP